jgi:hypothetical protein
VSGSASAGAQLPRSSSTAANQPAVIVGDTGPLLCAGLLGTPIIKRMLNQMSGRLVVPNAVYRELVRRSRNSKEHDLMVAAQRVLAYEKTLFIPNTTSYARNVRGNLRREIEAKERQRKGPGGSGHGQGGHDGEIEATLYAEANGAILLSNDIAARQVAGDHRVATATFKTVLAVEVRAGRMDGAQAAQLCRQVKKRTFPGDHQLSPVTFSTMHIPRGFAP